MHPKARINLVILFAAFLNVASMTTSEAQTKGCGPACIEEKVCHHLELMAHFDQARALDVSLAELEEPGPPAARVADDVYEDLTGAAWAARSGVKPGPYQIEVFDGPGIVTSEMSHGQIEEKSNG